MVVQKSLKLKDFADLIHHRSLVIHKRMDISVQCYHRVLVTEYFGEGFDVHSALYCSCCEGVAKSMKSFSFNTETALQQLKATLIRADRNNAFAPRNNQGRLAFLFHLLEQRQELLRQRNDSP